MNVVVPLEPLSYAGGAHCSDAALAAALHLRDVADNAEVTAAAFGSSPSLTWALAAGADRAMMAGVHGAAWAGWIDSVADIADREKPDVLLVPNSRDRSFEELTRRLDRPIIPDVVAIYAIGPSSIDVAVRERAQYVIYRAPLPAVLSVGPGHFELPTVTLYDIAAAKSQVTEHVPGTDVGRAPHEERDNRSECEFAPDTEALARIITGEAPKTAGQLFPSPSAKLQRLASRPAYSRPHIADARVVVAGGRAFAGALEFERLVGGLASVLGGAVAGTGAVAVAGMVESGEVVGQSRLAIAPRLYLALGISGVDQHIGGIDDDAVVVAVNCDKQAPIFARANYGLVGDVRAVAPQLISLLESQNAPIA